MPIEQKSPKEPSPSISDASAKDQGPNPVRANAARHIVRKSMKATMASLDVSSGAPYASLVAVATMPSCTPILAMSSLSHHHANISADGRVSLLFDGTPEVGDALEGGRVSISGTLELTKDEAAKRRFMARHPDAYYTEFADFSFFTLHIDRVHYIAGFGRVRWFKQADFLLSDDLSGSEADAMSQIMAHHTEALTKLAQQSWEASNGPLTLSQGENWHICGLDAEGADIIANGRATRLEFPQKITSTEAATLQIALMTENK